MGAQRSAGIKDQAARQHLAPRFCQCRIHDPGGDDAGCHIAIIAEEVCVTEYDRCWIGEGASDLCIMLTPPSPRIGHLRLARRQHADIGGLKGDNAPVALVPPATFSSVSAEAATAVASLAG